MATLTAPASLTIRGDTTVPVESLGGLLFPEHVAQIWTEERRKVTPGAPEVKKETVHDYVRWSKEGKRYADNPVPEAKARRGDRQPAWYADQEDELRAWWRSRRGQGWRAGTGGRGQ